MKTKFIFFAFIFGILFAACKQEKKVLNHFMVGTWQTEYIKIKMPTFRKTDSTSVVEDNFSKPNINRAQSTYNNDGTFIAWFKQPDGKKVNETKGKWKAKGDSLYVDYTYSGKLVQAWYKVNQTNQGFSAKVIYDWDNDGEYDDTLIMKSKKIK